jgi:hypothetical protein
MGVQFITKVCEKSHGRNKGDSKEPLGGTLRKDSQRSPHWSCVLQVRVYQAEGIVGRAKDPGHEFDNEWTWHPGKGKVPKGLWLV